LGVRFRSGYVEDLGDIYGFLMAESPRAAATLLARVEEVTTLIVNFPAAGRRRRGLAAGLRSFRVRGFRYVVFYRIEGRDVVMVRLLHGARRIQRGLFVE
jgi:toxin ParE1/3/4